MLWLLACSSAPDVEVVAARELGPLETTDAVKARDGGSSVSFGDRTVWLYGDSILSLAGEDGQSWRDNTWSWTTDLDASDGLTGFTEPVDGYGAPEELFPETEEEVAYNADHRGDDCVEPCGGREVLWPMAAVEDVARDRVLAFYVKIHGEPGAWNFYPRGYGVAVWEDFEAGPTRPEVAPGAEEPTLLFTEEVDAYGGAAVIVDDHLYAYACEGDGEKPCRVARVELADVLDRGAWTFWDGEGWVADVEHAATLFAGNSQLSVHYNPLLDRFVAVHIDGVSDQVVLRTAEAPEGPWSREAFAFSAEPAAGDGWVYCGYGHAELMGEGGRYEYVSYYRSTGDWTGEVRVVEVEVR